MMIFNFEEWAQLARQDQAAFERKRAAAIREVIEEAASNETELRRLNGLQFRVDMIRRQHKTPLGACVAISEMLMANVYQLIDLDLDELYQQAEKKRAPHTETCKIIPFRPTRK